MMGDVVSQALANYCWKSGTASIYGLLAVTSLLLSGHAESCSFATVECFDDLVQWSPVGVLVQETIYQNLELVIRYNEEETLQCIYKVPAFLLGYILLPPGYILLPIML